MKHYYLLTITILLLSRISFAQTGTLPRVEKSQFTYHLLVGLSYETGVSRLNTFRISGPLNVGFNYETHNYNGYSESQFSTFIRPNIQGEFRHYYNLDKRSAQGKRVDKNSGNFLAPVVNIFGPAIAKSENIEVADFAAVIGAAWGIQRNYGKNFNFQLSIGPGIGFAEDEVKFAPVGNLSLGFRIGK